MTIRLWMEIKNLLKNRVFVVKRIKNRHILFVVMKMDSFRKACFRMERNIIWKDDNGYFDDF